MNKTNKLKTGVVTGALQVASPTISMAGTRRIDQERKMKSGLLFFLVLFFAVSAFNQDPDTAFSGATMHLSYETEADILSDFLSAAHIYRVAKPGEILENPLERRKLELSDGKFGKALHIKHGWSVTRGTINESGIDLDLIVATMWGDWRTKPHYWGTGKFYGERGSIAFWVKTSALNPGIVFIQGSTAWGRKERDLLRIDLDKDGKLSASIRDIFYQYHRIESEEAVWINDKWQHVVVVYDKAYGLKLYHDGKLIASNWGEDSWWQTPLPGLFSPFLPESYYDEIFFFDYPLNDNEIASLYTSNSLPPSNHKKTDVDDLARERLLSSYGDVENLDLPVLIADEDVLVMKQTEIADCHDEKIPAWWVMDGRYELAWPHPYLSFTFILGDVDFHGDKIDIDFKDGEAANYISLEGVLDGIEVISGEKGEINHNNQIIDLNNYPHFFYSTKIDVKNPASLHFPLVKGYGTPPGLVDRGSLKFPLSGKMRIHEVQLWNVTTKKEANKADIVWQLPYEDDLSNLDLRYLDALLKLKCPQERTLFVGSNTTSKTDLASVDLAPLQSFHFFSPNLNPDLAIDKIGLNFYVSPEKKSDVLWVKVRDPANPSRIWAQTVSLIEFKELHKPQKIEIELDPVDIMLAGEDRLWVELMFANKEKLASGHNMFPEINVVLSKDWEKSLSDYAFSEMIPARMQYMKEYNYQPWLFTGEQRNKDGIKFWTKFGGPYDMWYPPDAVLRHDPDHEIAGIYKRITGERGSTYGGRVFERTFNQYDRLELSENIPPDAPSWAVWEREMYKKQLRTLHWIVNMQRKDGFFWGGSNDDVFIPLGYAGIPFMGDEISRKAFLKLYDGLEESGVYKDGYCDIWPIDYLHITDFIVSRGLMVPYALGDPYVLEREMTTARVYKDIMDKTNDERSEKGLPPFEFNDQSKNEEPKLWAEKLVHDYELTQVHWYWGKSPELKLHRIDNRNEVAREMMNVASRYDKTEEYEWTRAMRHTDKQGGAPGRNQLVSAALGGRLQGRIEPHPHSMVVSWDNPDPDIARLVYYADKRSVKINLYNFKSEPQKITMRLWRILKGEYLLKVGRDLNDDGEIDSEKYILQEKRIKLHRFSSLKLVIPSKENIAVQLMLVKKMNRPATLPDLAIHPVRDVKREGDKLIVTVHNIGDGYAKNIQIEVIDRDGKVMVKSVIPEIEAPVNLVPVTETIEFDLAGKEWYKIVIDRNEKIEEIYEENNEVINESELN